MDAANANLINSNPWNLLGLITGIAVMALMLLGQDPNIIIILQGATLVCILLGLLHSLKHKGTLDSAINQLQRLLKDGTQQFVELDLPGWKPLLDELSRWRQSQQQQQAILKALDICQANVMVANPAGDILYFNHSLQQTMQDAEADIQEVLPKFQADKLQGANMDVFHRNPEHQRKLIAGLEQVYSTQIKVGRRAFSLIASPVFDENKQRIATVVEWQDLTEALSKQQLELQSATENTRIKQALNVCQANVMVADTDYNIIYLNDSLNEMLAGNEQKLQQELQAFNMSKLIGSNIDIFHRHPEHQRQLLDQLTDSYNTRIKVAGLTFNLIATRYLNRASVPAQLWSGRISPPAWPESSRKNSWRPKMPAFVRHWIMSVQIPWWRITTAISSTSTKLYSRCFRQPRKIFSATCPSSMPANCWDKISMVSTRSPATSAIFSPD